MIITQNLCGKCGSAHMCENGSSGGRAKYQCTAPIVVTKVTSKRRSQLF